MSKKRIIFVMYMIICGVLLVVLTGCGNKTSEIPNNKVQNSVEENNEKNKTIEKESNTDSQDTNNAENEKLKVGEYTLEYGKYEGTANSGGYTLTETCELEKDKITLGAESFEYTVKGNEIVAKNADAIRFKITNNNNFTDAQGTYKFTYADKSTENIANNTNKNTDNKNTDNDNIKTNENSKSNLKLDARYIYQDSNVAIQIELYKDNTMYYSYVPKKQRTSEYYEGTFSIDGNKLIMNLTADGENMGTEVIKNGNKLTCTILSNTEFKDENGRTIKFSIDYPKGLRPNER